jgi:hypothetical protein
MQFRSAHSQRNSKLSEPPLSVSAISAIPSFTSQICSCSCRAVASSEQSTTIDISRRGERRSRGTRPSLQRDAALRQPATRPPSRSWRGRTARRSNTSRDSSHEADQRASARIQRCPVGACWQKIGPRATTLRAKRFSRQRAAADPCPTPNSSKRRDNERRQSSRARSKTDQLP